MFFGAFCLLPAKWYGENTNDFFLWQHKDRRVENPSLPLRRNQRYEVPVCRKLSWHRTGMDPCHSKGFYDRETASQEDTSFVNSSRKRSNQHQQQIEER